MAKTLKVLFASDIHTGGLFALSKLRSKSPKKDDIHIANSWQKELYKLWQKMIKDVGHVDLTICTGDNVDGINYKDDGVGQWTTDMKWQSEEAADLIAMIDSDEYLFIKGSKYHINHNLSCDEYVSELVGQLTNKRSVFRDRCILELKTDKKTWRLDVNHMGPNFQYFGGGLEKEYFFSKKHDSVFGDLDFIIRGHCHQYSLLDKDDMCIIGLPCWKAHDWYAQQRGNRMVQSSVGWVVLNLTEDGWDYDKHIGKFKNNRIPILKMGVD